jgi:antitoxin (DNA-binding transcriptional repressor) of toxin-antitoxin stability system
MCHMEKASVRDLHLKTSAMIKNVAQGQSYVIESRGVPVAELRPSRRSASERSCLIAKRLFGSYRFQRPTWDGSWKKTGLESLVL